MRVANSDLDDTVVTDGETTIMPKSEAKSIPAKPQDVNGVQLKQTSNDKFSKPQNSVVIPMGKKREPVEDTYEHEDTRSNGDVDTLAAAFRSCAISAAGDDTGCNLEKQLVGLSLKEEDSNDNENEESKSSSSVITVDPPSLPHEEEEETCESPESVDLESRGPTKGVPSNYRPDDESYYHVAGKSYYSHNLGIPVPQQHSPQHFASSFDSSFTYCSMAVPKLPNDSNYNHPVPNSSGKRRINDDAENLFNPPKYTRPVEEVGEGYQHQQQLNDLNMGATGRPTHLVSRVLGTGGQVTHNPDTTEAPSPSPTEEFFGDGFPLQHSNYTPQYSVSDIHSLLEELKGKPDSDTLFEEQQQHQQQSAQTVPGHFTEFDPGYSSENSPHSENMGSPGSSPKSACSPQRPPSNMSHDSGVASPYSEDSMHLAMASPASDCSHVAPGGSVRSMSSSHVSAMSPHPAYVASWTSANVREDYHNCLHPSLQVPYMSPSSVLSDDYSMASTQSPANGLDTYFEEHNQDLKEALEVVARDIECNLHKKKNTGVAKVNNVKVMPANSMVASQINGVMPTFNSNRMPPTQTVLPVSMAPTLPQQVIQAESRPNKLPIPALSKNLAQKPVASSVPFMMVPSTMAQQGHTMSTVVPATTSQPVIMIPNGQAAQSIIVLVKSSPPPPPQKKTITYVPIRPKIPSPLIPPSDPSPKAKTEVIATKTAPIVHATQTDDANAAVNRNALSGQSPMQPPSAHSPSAQKPCAQVQNCQQAKMLNIARRLVASMTTDDLQFKDLEGDTYLHVSVCKADRNMVQALLERMTREKLHVMINAQNSMRQTSLYLAVSSNHPEMVELLIQYGADVNLFAEHIQSDGVCKEIKAALHCAVSNGAEYLFTLRALLAAPNLKMDILNSDGHTPIHCAILEHGKVRGNEVIDNLPIIQTLIKYGANLDAQGQKSGKTALMYAMESRNISLIEHVVTCLDPILLRSYLRSQAFDGNSCMRILENIQRDMSQEHRQRLHACLKLTTGSRKENYVA